MPSTRSFCPTEVEKLEQLRQSRIGKGKLVWRRRRHQRRAGAGNGGRGIAMGGAGTDAAIEAADIVLMRRTSRLVSLIRISRKTGRIVLQNYRLRWA